MLDRKIIFLSILVGIISAWVLLPSTVSYAMYAIRSFLKSKYAYDTFGVYIEHFLAGIGVPPPYPSLSSVVLIITTAGMVLLAVHLLSSHEDSNQKMVHLKKDLESTRKRLIHLQNQISQIRRINRFPNSNEKPVRIFMEGAFDIMHYGHMNAFRLGASLFTNTYLIVGVNSDETITKCKGPPVMNDEERIAMVQACRFVKEVVPKTPYVMTPEYLNEIMTKYNIDYVVHGDDPCIVDGRDVYEHVKSINKYVSIPRTEGVSTTDIVGRMLLVSKGHHEQRQQNISMKGRVSSLDDLNAEDIQEAFASKFLSTANLLRLFSRGCKKYVNDGSMQVVYLDGAWDMFHAGHVDVIKQARGLVTNPFVIIGVHNDDVVNHHRGLNYPIMNMQERLLSVLGCTHCDDVLIDAPWKIDEKMIKSLQISIVVHGTVGDYNETKDIDPYVVPKVLGIYKEVESKFDLSIYQIVRRIQDNQDRFVNKFLAKMAKEKEYYNERYGIETS